MIVKNYLCNVLCKFLIKIESTWRRGIKEQTPQLTLLYCGRTFRSSHRRCSIKEAVLKIFAISTWNTCVGVSFKKSCRSEGLQLYYTETSTQVLSREYCEIFKTYFEKHRLLFDCFNGSLSNGPKVSRSRMYDVVKLHGVIFLFLRQHLSPWTESRPGFENLRRIPLIGQLSFYISYFWLF